MAGWIADAETDDAQIGWGRDVYSSLAEHTTGGAYINFLSDDDEDRVRAAYGEKYDRLVAAGAAPYPLGYPRTTSLAE